MKTVTERLGESQRNWWTLGFPYPRDSSSDLWLRGAGAPCVPRAASEMKETKQQIPQSGSPISSLRDVGEAGTPYLLTQGDSSNLDVATACLGVPRTTHQGSADSFSAEVLYMGDSGAGRPIFSEPALIEQNINVESWKRFIGVSSNPVRFDSGGGERVSR